MNGEIKDKLSKFIKICKSGEAPNHYSIGDKIIVPYGEGIKLGFTIIGFDKDTKQDGSKAKVSLLSSECIPECENVCFGYEKSSSSNSSYGGYYYLYTDIAKTKPSMRNVVTTTVFSMLPDVLQNAAEPVKKIYPCWSGYLSGGFHIGQSNPIVYDKLWIPVYNDVRPNGLYSIGYEYVNEKYCMHGLKRKSIGMDDYMYYILGDTVVDDGVQRDPYYIDPDGCHVRKIPADTPFSAVVGLCIG